MLLMSKDGSLGGAESPNVGSTPTVSPEPRNRHSGNDDPFMLLSDSGIPSVS